MKKNLFLVLINIKDFLRLFGIKKIPGAMPVYNFFFKLTRPSYAIVDGDVFFCDRDDDLELTSKSGHFERFVRSVFQRETKNGDIFFDIGAHIGYNTILASRLVGEQGRVFAFEPFPENFQLLKKNVAANSCRNVSILEMAISDQNGTAKLFLDKESIRHSLYGKSSDSDHIEVETTTLDDFLKKNGMPRVDVIKMDIEGGEMRALRGMANMLRCNRKLKIFTEFYPHDLKLAGVKPNDYLKELRSFGLEIYNINSREELVEKISDAELLARYTFENDEVTNLFCVRN